MNKITPEEVDNIKLIVSTVMDAMLPSLIKVVAAARPDTSVHAAGDLLVATSGSTNDYRQSLWSRTFSQNDSLGADNGAACADAALAEFDKRFPQ